MVQMARQHDTACACVVRFVPHILKHSEIKLQEILNVLQSVFADWGVEVNIPKTKIMHVGAQGTSSREIPVLMNGERLECVSNFKYLGSHCSNDLSMKIEINHRLSCAAFAFQKLKRLHVLERPFYTQGY